MHIIIGRKHKRKIIIIIVSMKTIILKKLCSYDIEGDINKTIDLL